MKSENRTARLKVAAVSFLNTVPFIYGIDNSNNSDNYDLFLGSPIQCSNLLKNSHVDIALIPVAEIVEFEKIYIIKPYCLAANNKVNSVFILSNDEIRNIKKIYLDPQSATSNNLAKVLCKQSWNINPEFVVCNMLPEELNDNEAIVAIGDKTFKLKKNYKFQYDLAEHWEIMTKLPFVFAVWATTKNLTNDVISKFNNSLKFGTENICSSLVYSKSNVLNFKDSSSYLNKNIKYELTDKMLESLEMFLKLIKPEKELKIHYKPELTDSDSQKQNCKCLDSNP